MTHLSVKAMVRAFAIGGLLLVCGLILGPQHAQAAINPQINFQGKLTNTDGTNVTDGTYSIRFRIYTDPTADTGTCANTCKWEETQASVSVSGGLFTANLGSVTTLPGSVDFNNATLYLGVKVGSDSEMTPRVRLTAVPQAFNSDLLDGLDSSALAQLSPGSPQTGNINISGTITAGGAVNGITISNTIQPSAAGALTVRSNGANALNLTGGAASTWDIGNNLLSIQTTGNGAITTGTGLLTVGGNLTFSGTTLRTVTGPSTGGLTINVTSGPLTLSTTTAGALTVTSAGALTLDGASVAITSDANITLGAVDGTATLLVLDSKNTTGDSTAVNGAEYYNSANNKFRCAQGGIWSDCTTGFNSVTKTADQAATQSSTTFQNDSVLTFTVNANTTYVFDAWIPVNDSNTTADLKYTFTTPTGATLNIMTQYYSTATANVICNIVTSGTACANTTVNLANHFIQVRGQVTVAGTAGAVRFQFAQNTSTAASFPVIKKGATLTWKQSN